MTNLLSSGQGPRSFLEQLRPGPNRMMPTVAGFQRPDSRIPSQQRTIMQNSPMMPTLSGPQPVGRNVEPCLGCTTPTRMLKGLRGFQMPTWLKWALPIGLIVGGGAIAWHVYKR